MCSNPQPNSFAPTGKVACRKCNQCITAYKNDWVARCMAEMATMGNAMVLMLSYPNNADGSLPDSARAFQYKDVQDFMKRLRKAYGKHYKIDPKGEISYVCAGELGSRTKRVHWHMVLFSKRPLHLIGEWTSLKGKAMAGPKITRKGWNQNWSVWSNQHGYVCPQIPDQGGVAYVLKYAMKDKFNLVEAQGTARFTKAERHAAGFFRMSKKPAIGWRYLQEQVIRWEVRGAVPPDLNIKIPDYSGYYWPKGPIRKALLIALHDINHTINEDHGRDAPQWATLRASLAAREADLQLLVLRSRQVEWEYEQRQNNQEYQEERRQSTLAQRAAFGAKFYEDNRYRSGAILAPHDGKRLSADDYQRYKEWFDKEHRREEVRQGRKLTATQFDRWWRLRNEGSHANPFHPDTRYAKWHRTEVA